MEANEKDAVQKVRQVIEVDIMFCILEYELLKKTLKEETDNNKYMRTILSPFIGLCKRLIKTVIKGSDERVAELQKENESL